jgi:cytochrome c peroxidase
MTAVFGADIFKDSTKAFQRVVEAIAAYETTNKLQSFSSRYDQFVAGKAQLTPIETSGMKLFMDPQKGNCASCHTMNPKASGPKDNLFTDFGHYATGIPRNMAIPANANAFAIRRALQDLDSIGSGNVSVAEIASAAGTHTFEIRKNGTLAKLPELRVLEVR